MGFSPFGAMLQPLRMQLTAKKPIQKEARMSGVTEQRLTQRLKTYWDLIRKAQLMPQIEHFNTSAIDDLWHQCMQISVDTRKGAIFKCEFMGDNLIRACGRDIAGELIEAAGASFPGSLMHKHLMLIVTTPRAL